MVEGLYPSNSNSEDNSESASEIYRQQLLRNQNRDFITTVMQRLFDKLALPPFETVEQARLVIKEYVQQDPSRRDYIDALIDHICKEVKLEYRDGKVVYDLDSQFLFDDT